MAKRQSNYSRLIGYVLPSYGFFLISFLGFIIFAGSQVAIAEWFRQIVDFVSNPIPEQYLYLPVALVVLALVRGLGFYLGSYFMAYVATKLVHDLRSDLFVSIVNLPSKFFDSNTSGHLLSRITFNVSQVSEAGTEAVKIILREGLIVLGLIGYLIYLNWQLTLVLVFTSPFIAGIVFLAGKRLRRVSTRIQNAMGDVTHLSSESINANKEVKLFGRQNSEFEKLVAASDHNRIQSLKLESTNAIASPLIQVILSIALATITWFAIDASVITKMSSGTFIAFFGAAAMLAKPIRQLSITNSMIQRGLAAAEVIFNQIDEKDEEDFGTHKLSNSQGEIEFSNVNFRYEEMDTDSLRNISFSVSKGSTLAIVGSSGAGKSTLVNLIPRFYEVTDGEIKIDGINTKDLSLKSLRSEISFVSQNTILFNDTILNNIRFAKPDASKDDVISAARQACADEFITKLPQGYDTKIGDDGTLLSGGQKQRIAIARALLKDCSILVLDEATSALDSESETFVQEAVDNLKEGKTTIVIAHRLSTVENADEILVLSHGKISERGSHQDLINRKGEYFDLYKNQFTDLEPQLEDRKPVFIPELKIEESTHSSYIENAWYKNKFWIKLFYPLSIIFNLISKYRRRKLSKTSWKPSVKTIVVGNITVGGNGKTPFVIWLVNTLKRSGFKPGVISRGYKSTSKKIPIHIDSNTDVYHSGDEAKIIYNSTNCPVVVGPKRVNSAKYLLDNFDCDVLITDDGLQHYALGRDIEIAMVDGIKKFGNQLTLPAGPLREPVNRLEEVDFVINTNSFFKNESQRKDNEYLMKYKPISWVNIYTKRAYDIQDWPFQKMVHAVAGISNPNNFFSSLRSLGFDVIEHVFPDHYNFSKNDFEELNNLPVVMTEKDAVKCEYLNDNFWYLKIEAQISDNLEKEIVKKIKS